MVAILSTWTTLAPDNSLNADRSVRSGRSSEQFGTAIVAPPSLHAAATTGSPTPALTVAALPAGLTFAPQRPR